MSRGRRSLAPARGLAAGVLATALASVGGPATAGAASADGRPNVVVVMTDDQTVAQLSKRTMPATTAAFASGTTFTNSFVSSPLCCPSRAGFLTGAYAHNNGVYDNTPGYPALADKRQTLFTWLQASGYRTGHVGRYLLNYPDPLENLGGALGPPGVDDWFGYIDQPTYYYNGRFSNNGFVARAGFDPVRGYSTAVINREAGNFIAESSRQAKPFFLSVAHLAPHTVNSERVGACGSGTPVASPGTYERFARARLPRPPSFDERRITDKPAWVRSRRRLSSEKRALLRRGWRCALASLTDVDRGVAGLVEQLRALGELDNTAIFFTSDNGLAFGEHRLVQQKAYPYDEILRVPLLALVPDAYLPAGSRPAEVSQPVTNLDLSATILELARTPPCTSAGCRGIDGRSLISLLGGELGGWPRRRGVLAEIGNPSCARDPAAANGLANFYSAIRTPAFLYVELNHVDAVTGLCDRREYELYNMRRDPSQLRNIARDPARSRASKTQRRLAARLAALRNCAGVAERDRGLAGRPFCE